MVTSYNGERFDSAHVCFPKKKETVALCFEKPSAKTETKQELAAFMVSWI